jgi:ribose 5-phosphate isomerase B
MEPVLIASDHAGYGLKHLLVNYLEDRGIEVFDLGCDDEISCDYPKFAQELCGKIREGSANRGILICGTGLGMSMAANRFPGIRAALCTTEFHARMSRSHNDSNVLVLGSRITAIELAQSIVNAWLETPFEGGRHQRRVDLLDGPSVLSLAKEHDEPA